MSKTQTQAQTLPNLATVVFESEEAAKEAAALRAKLDAADRKAAEARQKVDAEQSAALRRYLDKVQREHSQAHTAALDAKVDARAALESAVREGTGDVFRTYATWVSASIALWQVDAELQTARDLNGQPSRETPVPEFDFGTDIARILNHLSFELQDQALQAIKDRRHRFMRGQEN